MTTDAKNDKGLLEGILDHPLGRRRFAKVSGALAGTAAAAGAMLRPSKARALNDPGIPDAPETAPGVSVRYSVCLGCHSKCGIAVRVESNTITKIDGNPWHPNNAETGERLDFSASITDGRDSTAGTLCPKGQAGVEVMYNPFRIQMPLKRVGARGAGQWQQIGWDQALTEIAERLRPFYEGHAAGTDIPTADGSGALGTIANQVLFSPGRWQHGQKEFTDRLFRDGFGTQNYRHDHTSICETSHHVSGSFMTERFLPSQSAVKYHFKPEIEGSQYVIWFGTSPLEANFPAQTLAKRVAKSRNAGTKHVIVDPRHSRSCAFAHRWLPVVPGQDAALALGIARRIISQGNHNVPALEAANYAAAQALSSPEHEATDATYLVVVRAPDESAEMLFHRMGGSFAIADRATGVVTALQRGATAAAQTGRLELTGTEPASITASAVGLDPSVVGHHVIDLGGGIYAAPVFQLYRARVFSRTMDQYAAACGIDAGTIGAVADEFAAAAPACNANAYRGVAQHTDGVAAVQAVMALNALVMSYEHRGGTVGGTGGHLHEMGGKAAGQLSLDGAFGSPKRPRRGPEITRVKSFFDAAMASALGESTSAPTRRQWFPYAYNGNYQELLPSIEDQYPYAGKVLITLWNNIAYSAPAGREVAYRVLSDESKIPLHVCFDIEMSETAALADYVLPDGSYFERWSTPHNAPTILTTLSCFRSPVVGYYANKVGTNGRTYWQSLEAGDLQSWGYTIDWSTERGPFTAEDILLELMRRVAGGSLSSVAGFGDDAYYESAAAMAAAGVSPSMRTSLKSAWDWYWNVLVNFAIEAGASPSDSAGIQAMVHAIVARGGWFEDTPPDRSAEYSGAFVKNRMKAAEKGKAIHLFHEYADAAGRRYRDPFSLRCYDPLPAVATVTDSAGDVVDDGTEYPFTIVTYKPMYHSQGRTDSLPALTSLEPENYVEMSSADARRLGLCNGDLVRVTSATSATGVRGRLRVTERLRPGVVAISHSRGRWEINSRPYRRDGALTSWDPRRGRGVNGNPILRTDPHLPNVSLQDPIGGSASFYDTKVKIERATTL